MTPEQIALVERSFRLVLPAKDPAAALFYARLFEIDPSTRPLFARTDLAAQGGKLMAALGFVVGALRTPGPLLETATALARRHVGYGVQRPHYESVGAALLWTLERGLGEAWTPETAEAWTAAYTLLAGAMIAAAEEAEPAMA
jgi:nitric oxide dioxygenase